MVCNKILSQICNSRAAGLKYWTLLLTWCVEINKCLFITIFYGSNIFKLNNYLYIIRKVYSREDHVFSD